MPVCSFQSQLLIRLLHTRIRMSRNDPSRLLRDNLATAAKVTIMQHTWLRTGRRYPIVFAEKQLKNVFLMLFVLPSGCRVYHPTRGEWGGGGGVHSFSFAICDKGPKRSRSSVCFVGDTSLPTLTRVRSQPTHPSLTSRSGSTTKSTFLLLFQFNLDPKYLPGEEDTCK